MNFDSMESTVGRTTIPGAIDGALSKFSVVIWDLDLNIVDCRLHNDLDSGSLKSLLLKMFGKELFNPGSYHLTNQRINTGVFDIFVVNEGSSIQVLCNPVTMRYAKQMEYYQKSGLTDRELEVVELLLARLSNGDIVDKLMISPNTLRTHLKSIYRRVGSQHQSELKSLRKV